MWGAYLHVGGLPPVAVAPPPGPDVVQALQEEEDDDAPQGREAVEGLLEVVAAVVVVQVHVVVVVVAEGVPGLPRPHADGLQRVACHTVSYLPFIQIISFWRLTFNFYY